MKLKALLRKDICVLIKQMKLFIAFILVFAIMPGANVNIFAILYAAMLPYTAMSYDAHSHWDELSAMMPYSVFDLVASKYLLGWAFAGGSTVLSLLARFVTAPFLHTDPAPFGILMGLFVSFLFMALSLPWMFYFGVEKGRMMMIVVIAAIGGAAGGLSGLFFDTAPSLPNVITLLLPLAALAATVLSIPLSMKLYQKRRFA